MLAEQLSWAYTGALNSRNHVAKIEPFQNQALCGVNILGMVEIRPRTLARLCPKCERELRKFRVNPQEIGIENDLRGDV
jgi:hypothetical protein